MSCSYKKINFTFAMKIHDFIIFLHSLFPLIALDNSKKSSFFLKESICKNIIFYRRRWRAKLWIEIGTCQHDNFWWLQLFYTHHFFLSCLQQHKINQWCVNKFNTMSVKNSFHLLPHHVPSFFRVERQRNWQGVMKYE